MDLWSEPHIDGPTEILISPAMVEHIKSLLTNAGMQINVVTEDVQVNSNEFSRFLPKEVSTPITQLFISEND